MATMPFDEFLEGAGFEGTEIFPLLEPLHPRLTLIEVGEARLALDAFDSREGVFLIAAD